MLSVFSDDRNIEERQSFTLLKLQRGAKIAMPLADSFEKPLYSIGVNLKNTEHIVDVS